MSDDQRNLSALKFTPPDGCDHDWRVNPHIVLTTNPPQRQHVCAKCHATKASGFPKGWKNLGHDQEEWPRV